MTKNNNIFLVLGFVFFSCVLTQVVFSRSSASEAQVPPGSEFVVPKTQSSAPQAQVSPTSESILSPAPQAQVSPTSESILSPAPQAQVSPTSEFVISKTQKKKKRKSKSKLQEQACQVFASQMSYGPEIHKHVADMQQVLLEQTIKYIESSKDGVLVKNKKDKIDEIVRVAQEFEEKMEQFCKECEQYVNYLNSQKAACVP